MCQRLLEGQKPRHILRTSIGICLYMYIYRSNNTARYTSVLHSTKYILRKTTFNNRAKYINILRIAYCIATKMEVMADLNFLLALNTRNRCRLSPSWLSASSSSPVFTHEWERAWSAVIRCSWSTVSSLHS